MPKFVNLILCSENQPLFNILSHLVLAPATLLSIQLWSLWPHVNLALPAILNIRDLNSSRSQGCLYSICVQVLPPGAYISVLVASQYYGP